MFAAFAAPGPPPAFAAFDPPAVVQSIPARAVPAARPFRGPVYSAGHTCPVCGRSQYVVGGYLPGGRHTHTCVAGHTWFH